MFVLRMALRETRSSWQRLLFFFICIAVGVGAIVTIRSVIQSVRTAFNDQARTLIAADVIISTSRDWTEDALAKIGVHLQEVEDVVRTETVETPTMVRPADESRIVARMVELRAVQPGFPLYGSLEIEGGRPYSHDLLKGRGVLVRPELLAALKISVGEAIVIGQVPFTIRGVIANEPGRSVGNFSMGPRVLIDYDDLPATGLVTFGSRARRALLLRTTQADIQPLVEAIRADFKDEFVNVRSFRSREDDIGEDFDRAENYLSMVGLVIVILGGIAVSSVVRVFVLQKMRGIAVLKCVGARTSQIIGIYLVQVLTLGVAGSLLGVVLALLAIAALPYAIQPAAAGAAASMLSTVKYGVTWSAALQGVGSGVLVSLLFSLVPLLQVRDVKPSLLLRDEKVASRRDWTRIGVTVLVSAALVALTAWQAASLQVGLIVSAGFCGLALALQLAARALVRMVSPLANTRSFSLRHAVLHLSRPGNQTRVILLAVGLGAFFIVGVRSLQSSLIEEFSLQSSADAPDMFLMDVQRGQAEGLDAFLKDPANGASNYRLIPVLRARVTGVSGREVALDSLQDVRDRGSLAREYTITYRGELEPNERIAEGQFWNGPASEPEVSIEQSISERFQINVGDTVRFDILGRVIAAKVTSVRHVEWQDSRSGGFMFVFRPGVLESAPQMFITPLKGPATTEARAKFQYDLVERFPNVSVVDFREILATIQDIMSNVTLAITVVGGLVLFSGVLILIGAVAMTKFQRIYEAAVFKTLGATTRTIAQMLLFEYGVLGLLAGAVGSVGAVALTWGVSRYALDITWRPFLGEHLIGIVATAVLVAAIGVLSSLDVLRNKPLSTLRAE